MWSGLLYLLSTAPEPTVFALVLDYCFAVSASLQLSAAATHAKVLRQISGSCCSDWPPWEMGNALNGLLGWHSITLVCSGSLINSLQSAVVTYNIPFQPRNANLRVIGCCTIFRYFQVSCKFCQGSELPTLTVFIPSTEILPIPDGNTSGCALDIHQRLYWWVLCQGWTKYSQSYEMGIKHAG